MKVWALALGFLAYTVVDEWAQRAQAKWVARELASFSGKPILSIGAGPDLFGNTRCDIFPLEGAIYCNAQDLSQFYDKQFGVAFMSHVLEHVDNPEDALREAWRIADNVVVVVPSPLHPVAWLSPQHQWVIANQPIPNHPWIALAVTAGLGIWLWRKSI